MGQLHNGPMPDGPLSDKATDQDEVRSPPGLAVPLFATSILVALVAWLPWARRFTYSGCGVESLLILYGYGLGWRILPFIHIWTLLATFNLVYAVCSTSWLLFGLFVAACYPLIFITCLWQFDPVANFARRNLRRWLRQLHFTRDKIALFNLPALEIDTDVDGLLVVRGLSVSLSSLTFIAHGVELGIRLADDIELAISVDEVTISLFRRVQIGEVYGNLKGAEVEMMFANLGTRADVASDDDSIFRNDTPIMRAATLGSEGFSERPPLVQKLTNSNYMKDSPANAVLGPVKVLSPDDKNAETRYHEMLEEIQRTSAVGQSREKAKHATRSDSSSKNDELGDGGDRMAIVAALQELPSVPHPPTHSVRVTTLQNLSPPWVRRFLHRLPLLLRLLLGTLAYLHPIKIACVTAGVSGRWISTLLSQQVFKHYSDASKDVAKLERKVEAWLASSNFCVQLEDFAALAQVPISTISDIVAQIKLREIRAYRRLIESSEISQVVKVGGADGRIDIPTCLLPHHEHIVPARSVKSEHQDAAGPEETAGDDTVNMTFNCHVSLPARFDQSLLGFVAALVKATKIIELEKEFNEDEPQDSDIDEVVPPTSPTLPDLETEQESVQSGSGSPIGSPRFKTFARNIRQTMKDGTAGQSIKEFAKDLNQSTRDSMKKAVVVGVINDGWIAKMVGRVAAKLEKAQGSFGYSGSVAVPLEPYRLMSDGALTKLLA